LKILTFSLKVKKPRIEWNEQQEGNSFKFESEKQKVEQALDPLS